MTIFERLEYPTVTSEHDSRNIHHVSVVCTLYGGSKNAFDLLDDLLSQGIQSTVYTSDVGSKVFTSGPKERFQQGIYPGETDWIIISGGTEDDIRIAEQLKTQSPNARLAVLEQTSGQAKDVIASLKGKNLITDIVFTASRHSAIEQFGSLHERTFSEDRMLVVPLGSPELSHALEMPFSRFDIREKLGVSEHEYLILYAGRPDFVRYEIQKNGPLGKANSETLLELYNAIIHEATTNPDHTYCFMYKPHPHETDTHLVDNIRAELEKQHLANLRFIYCDSEYNYIEPLSLARASDLFVTIRSTMADHLAASATAIHTSEEFEYHPPILHILLNSQKKFIESSANHNSMATLRLGVGSFAETPEDIRYMLHALLSDADMRADKIALSQLQFLDEYRLRGISSHRILLWMRLWEKYNGVSDLRTDNTSLSDFLLPFTVSNGTYRSFCERFTNRLLETDALIRLILEFGIHPVFREVHTRHGNVLHFYTVPPSSNPDLLPVWEGLDVMWLHQGVFEGVTRAVWISQEDKEQMDTLIKGIYKE